MFTFTTWSITKGIFILCTKVSPYLILPLRVFGSAPRNVKDEIPSHLMIISYGKFIASNGHQPAPLGTFAAFPICFFPYSPHPLAMVREGNGCPTSSFITLQPVVSGILCVCKYRRVWVCVQDQNILRGCYNPWSWHTAPQNRNRSTSFLETLTLCRQSSKFPTSWQGMPRSQL